MRVSVWVSVSVVAVLAACSGKSRSKDAGVTSAEPKPPLPCDDPDLACYKRRVAECTNPAWRLRLGEALWNGEVYVSAAAVARIDVGGTRLYGTNGADWVACMERCPGSDTLGKVCFPYRLPFSFKLDFRKCQHSERERERWQGRRAYTIDYDCGIDGKAQAVYVPALMPARRALQATGIIDPFNPLSAIEGLVVTASAQGRKGSSSQDWVTEAVEVGCEVFALPNGYRMRVEADDRAEAARFYEELKQRTLQEGMPLAQAELDKLAPVLLQRLGQLCLGDQPSYTEAEVEACYKRRPELAAQGQAIADEMMAPLNEKLGSIGGSDRKAFDDRIDGPMCRHFAAR